MMRHSVGGLKKRSSGKGKGKMFVQKKWVVLLSLISSVMYAGDNSSSDAQKISPKMKESPVWGPVMPLRGGIDGYQRSYRGMAWYLVWKNRGGGIEGVVMGPETMHCVLQVSPSTYETFKALYAEQEKKLSDETK
jgi:hypothetical protein